MNTQKYNFYANDKLAFFNDCVLVNNNKSGKITNIEMPDWKIDVLNSNNMLIKKMRNAGVSELLAAEIAYNLNFTYGDMLYMAPNSSMCQYQSEKIHKHFNNIPDDIRIASTKKVQLKNKISTDNSSILLSPESQTVGRSCSFNCIYIEEVDFMNNFESVFTSLMPCISRTKGKIVITTTPRNQSHFHDLWNNTSNLFDRVEITYSNSTLPKIPIKNSLNDINKTRYFDTIRDCIIV